MQSRLTLNNMTGKDLLKSETLSNTLTYLESSRAFLRRPNPEEALNDAINKLKPFAILYNNLMPIQDSTAAAGGQNPKPQLRSITQTLEKSDPSLATEIKKQLSEQKISESDEVLARYKTIIRARCEQLKYAALICATWGVYISEKEAGISHLALKEKRQLVCNMLPTHLSKLKAKFTLYPFTDRTINLTFNTSLVSSFNNVTALFDKWCITHDLKKPTELAGEFKSTASSTEPTIHSPGDNKSEKKRDTSTKKLIDESEPNTIEKLTRRNQAQRRPKKVKGIFIGGVLAVIPPVALAIAWATNPILAFGYAVLAMLVGGIVGGVIDNCCCRRDDSLPDGAKRKLSDPVKESETSPSSQHSSLRTQRALEASASSLRRRHVASSSASASTPPSGEAKRQGRSSSTLSGSMQQTLDAAHDRGGKITKVGDAAADMADSATDFAALTGKLREKQNRSWF